MQDLRDKNVVFSHDWLTGMRGGERVLELLCEQFPKAPIYTLLHKKDADLGNISPHPIIASNLQNIPGVFKNYRYFLPFFPAAIERFKLPAETDLVLSTSHCVAKGLKAPEGAPHMCYCFTPVRYAWVFYEEYFGGNPLKAALLKPQLARLRDWDKKSSARVTRFVAISEHIRKRIERFYEREADIVFPPVDTERLTYDAAIKPEEFDLVVSALVPYKKVDLAVLAASRSGFPLKVVGTGTEFDALKAMAAPNVEFLGWQSDEAIHDLYRRCRCLLFPGEEDFGIVPVEVQACGRPVVAFAKGGAMETVVDGVSGVFFEDQSVDGLLDGIKRCADTSWDSLAIRKHSETFSEQNFLDGMAESMRKTLAEA